MVISNFAKKVGVLSLDPPPTGSDAYIWDKFLLLVSVHVSLSFIHRTYPDCLSEQL